jgi:hypothetical protein
MYPDSALVGVTGDFTSWRRHSGDDFWIDNDFCPRCGSRVVLRMKDQPGNFAISVGCFADPGFAAPKFIAWADSMHKWMLLPEEIEAKRR